MRLVLLTLLVFSLSLLGAIGRDDPVETTTPEPVEQPVEQEPEVMPQPVMQETVPVRELTPRHEFSLVFNGINRYSDTPPIARISLHPQTTESHTVELEAWFEIKVGEDEWYSVLELVDLLR